MNLIFKAMLDKHPAQEVVFRGRSRLETKRLLIRYWTLNQRDLDMKLSVFLRHCTLLPDNQTIVFKQGYPAQH